jgi:hypothetical protein
MLEYVVLDTRLKVSPVDFRAAEGEHGMHQEVMLVSKLRNLLKPSAVVSKRKRV